MLDAGTSDFKIIVIRNNGGIPSALLKDLAELESALNSLKGDGGQWGGSAESEGGVEGTPSILHLETSDNHMNQQLREPHVGEKHELSSGEHLMKELAASLPSSALARYLAAALRKLPPEEGSPDWPTLAGGTLFAPPISAIPATNDLGRLEREEPSPPSQSPGYRHATSPPSLLPALSRLSVAASLTPLECSVWRNSVRVWSAVRLAHVREWFTWYKAVEGGEASRFLWDGAFLDAHTAWGIIGDTHSAWKESRRRESAEGERAN